MSRKRDRRKNKRKNEARETAAASSSEGVRICHAEWIPRKLRDGLRAQNLRTIPELAARCQGEAGMRWLRNMLESAWPGNQAAQNAFLVNAVARGIVTGSRPESAPPPASGAVTIIPPAPLPALAS